MRNGCVYYAELSSGSNIHLLATEFLAQDYLFDPHSFLSIALLDAVDTGSLDDRVDNFATLLGAILNHSQRIIDVLVADQHGSGIQLIY